MARKSTRMHTQWERNTQPHLVPSRPFHEVSTQARAPRPCPAGRTSCAHRNALMCIGASIADKACSPTSSSSHSTCDATNTSHAHSPSPDPCHEYDPPEPFRNERCTGQRGCPSHRDTSSCHSTHASGKHGKNAPRVATHTGVTGLHAALEAQRPPRRANRLATPKSTRSACEGQGGFEEVSRRRRGKVPS